MAEFIDRTPQGLADALRERIEKLLISYWPLPEEMEYKDTEPRPPRVHVQYEPLSKTASQERNTEKDYPKVLILCLDGIINDFSEAKDGSEININIYFFGFHKDPAQGWRIPTSMLWRVLQDLLANTILSGYQLTPPIKWSPLNSDKPPYFTAMIETAWKGTPPAVEYPLEENYSQEISSGKNNEEITSAENGEG